MTAPVSKMLPAYHLKEHSCQYAELGISSSGERTAKLCQASLLEIPSKPLAWLHGELKTRLCRESPNRAGFLLRRAQEGENLSMPESRPMPSIGKVAMSFASQTLNTASNGGGLLRRQAGDRRLEVFERRRNKRPRHDRELPRRYALSRRKTHHEQSSARTIPTRWLEGRTVGEFLELTLRRGPHRDETPSRWTGSSIARAQPSFTSRLAKRIGSSQPVWQDRKHDPRSHSIADEGDLCLSPSASRELAALIRKWEAPFRQEVLRTRDGW